MILPEWLKPLEPLWMEWCGNREYLLKAKKIPFNEGVQRAALRKLTRLRDEGYDVEYVMEEAIANGWRGFWVNERTPRNLALVRMSKATYSARDLEFYAQFYKEHPELRPADWSN